jgi:hypothetical protein
MDRGVDDDDLRVLQAGSSDPFARSGDRWRLIIPTRTLSERN